MSTGGKKPLWPGHWTSLCCLGDRGDAQAFSASFRERRLSAQTGMGSNPSPATSSLGDLGQVTHLSEPPLSKGDGFRGVAVRIQEIHLAGIPNKLTTCPTQF